MTTLILLAWLFASPFVALLIGACIDTDTAEAPDTVPAEWTAR